MGDAMLTKLRLSFLVVSLGQVTETSAIAGFDEIGYGSCRSADVSRYPNHYLKTGDVNMLECVAQCNAEQGCTHMEWGLNGHRQNQCVIFAPQQQQAPVGWTFVHGNGGQSITQANGWSRESKCFAMATTEVTASYNFLGYGSCRSANVWQYPNHYLKTGNVNSEECVAQCNADQGCTHMEWGLNGNRENQCVIFSPQQQQGIAPRGWRFVPGNGGQSITQANGWSHVSTCSAKVHPEPANYRFLGTGSCRSDNHLTYPNHYLKTDPTNALTRFACVKQCNSEEGCTHMEWGLNGNGEKQCVVFCPQCDPSKVPKGWTFVPGNGGKAITQGNSWSDVSTCFAKSMVARSCQDTQDGYLHPKKTNPKICYKDHSWANYLTGYWGYEAVCGGAICEMEPGLALELTPQPYRGWWAGSCKVVQCKFNPRRLQEATSGQPEGIFV